MDKKLSYSEVNVPLGSMAAHLMIIEHPEKNAVNANFGNIRGIFE